jgi:hypothetical protein
MTCYEGVKFQGVSKTAVVGQLVWSAFEILLSQGEGKGGEDRARRLIEWLTSEKKHRGRN